MTAVALLTELDQRFSSENATATSWSEGMAKLEQAEIYWISTVRPDGRPHVTPMIATWDDGAVCFCTGDDERKARNIDQNAHVVVTTGCNAMGEGLDIVIEGDALRITDEDRLQKLAGLFKSKYDWDFTVRQGAFHLSETSAPALVFQVRPRKAFGFARGEAYSQTRWRF